MLDLARVTELSSGADGITLHLNGHSITGKGAGSGVSALQIGPGSRDVTIDGPGTIRSFGTGAYFRSAHNITIQKVFFITNMDGISLSQSVAVLIYDNVLLGSGHSTHGIYLSESTVVTVSNNKISFHAGPGVYYNLSGELFVLGNLVAGNQYGIQRGAEPGRTTIRNNTVSFNQKDGIVSGFCQVIEDNYVFNNGGSGIIVDRSQCPIQDNSVVHNGQYGIAVTQLSASQVLDNHAYYNAIDLYWDGTGVPCWKDNHFRTSNRALPACP